MGNKHNQTLYSNIKIMQYTKRIIKTCIKISKITSTKGKYIYIYIYIRSSLFSNELWKSGVFNKFLLNAPPGEGVKTSHNHSY